MLTIPARFQGPPGSANGGYACGALAESLAICGAIECTLRAPPPLDAPLSIERTEGAARLRHGEALVAEARSVALDLEVPPPISFDDAVEASRRYPGFRAHPYPGCFVCGPSRGEADGLRIFPGEVDGRGVVAAPWTPDASLPTTLDGGVADRVVWAALDCPGYFAVARGGAAYLLGRMTAELLAPVRAGVRHVVVGFAAPPPGVDPGDARKLFAGTALFDERGALLGRARQIWIRPRA